MAGQVTNTTLLIGGIVGLVGGLRVIPNETPGPGHQQVADMLIGAIAAMAVFSMPLGVLIISY